MEGPFAAGKHFLAAPELSDHYELVEVEVGRVIGVSSVDPYLGAQVSLRYVPSEVFIKEIRLDLRLDVCGTLGTTTLFPVSAANIAFNAR